MGEQVIRVELLGAHTLRTSVATVIKYTALCEEAGWNCEHVGIVNETFK